MRWDRPNSNQYLYFKGPRDDEVCSATGLTGTDPRPVAGLYPKSSGKWYAEVAFSIQDGLCNVGIAETGTFFGGFNSSLGTFAGSYGFRQNGDKVTGSTPSAYGSAWTTEVIGIALDMDNGLVYFSVDGVWQNGGDPETQTNPAFSGLTGEFYIAATLNSQLAQCGLRYHPYDTTYTEPVGFQPFTNFRKVTLTLRDETTAIIANTEFNWAFFNEPKGDLLALPCAKGTAWSDDNGLFEIEISDTPLPVGGIGSLLISDTAGVPAVQCRSWYMSVSIEEGTPGD